MRLALATFLMGVSVLSSVANAKIADLRNAGSLSGAWYIENAESDQVDAYLIIKSGEFDATGTEGMCHYLEHLVWHYAMGGGTNDKLNRDTNAYTTGTSVIYFLAGDTTQFDENLRILARAFETPRLPLKFMQEEREIVHQEYQLRDSEWPWLKASSDFESALYGPGSRARSIMGHPEQIMGFDIEEAMQLHALTHQPQNAVLVMIGNLPEQRVRESYRRHFAFNRKPAMQPKPPVVAMKAGTERMVAAVTGIPTGRFIFAKRIHLATAVSKQHLSVLAEILTDILQSTRAGSLAKPMRYDSFIASWMDVGFDIVSETEITMRFSAEPDIGVSLNHLQATFESEIDKLSNFGVPATTFAKIVAQKRKSLKTLDSKRATELSLALGSVYLDAAPISIEAYDQELATVKLDEINSVILAFAREGRTVMMYANQKPSP
jgi:zinc protease